LNSVPRDGFSFLRRQAFVARESRRLSTKLWQSGAKVGFGLTLIKEPRGALEECMNGRS